LTSALDNKQRTIIAAFPDFIAFENKYNRSVAKFEAELSLAYASGWDTVICGSPNNAIRDVDRFSAMHLQTTLTT